MYEAMIAYMLVACNWLLALLTTPMRLLWSWGLPLRIWLWDHTSLLRHGLMQLFIALDQLLNVLTNPFSLETWSDETLSSRCGRLGHRNPYRFWRKVIDAVFGLWQGPNHCVNAYAKERERYNCPPSMRGPIDFGKVIRFYSVKFIHQPASSGFFYRLPISKLRPGETFISVCSSIVPAGYWRAIK